ncbi:MAG: DUF6265 family protein [Cyclobacteriaceae bacterium]
MKKITSVTPAFIFLLFCLLTSLSLQTQAQSKRSPGTISDIRFIEGSWKAVSGDRSIDAVWSAPVGENMVGYVRVVREGQVSLYELFAFEKTDQGLVALVRHFTPGLIGREEKDTPNRYRFLEASKGRAYFEKQGEETRVLYEKRSNDQFAIVIGKKDTGEWVYKDFWVFSRVK